MTVTTINKRNSIKNSGSLALKLKGLSEGSLCIKSIKSIVTQEFAIIFPNIYRRSSFISCRRNVYVYIHTVGTNTVPTFTSDYGLVTTQ